MITINCLAGRRPIDERMELYRLFRCNFYIQSDLWLFRALLKMYVCVCSNIKQQIEIGQISKSQKRGRRTNYMVANNQQYQHQFVSAIEIQLKHKNK